MPIPSIKNDKAINALRSEYAKLYAPTTSWGNVVGMNLGLPHLIAYWPINIANEDYLTIDLSDNEHDLTHHP
jgi:hypothetical protein